ncbi:MAG TPA: hypothetical protein VGC79_02250 [Polyangiaceae bacterium]
MLAIGLTTLFGCGSKLIRLGDQTADVNAGSSGGAATGGGGAVVGGTTAAAGEGMVDSGGDDGAAGSGDACPHRQARASEVLWIGDSWITIPSGAQRARVRDLAVAAQAIDEGEDYFNLAAAASSMAAVAKQYDTRESGSTKVKVLLMDGGTWDPIAAQMAGASVPAAIDGAISTFQQFLAKVASDGTVEHIVYFLVPELATIPGVAMMRPRLQQACAESSVPCHFIDLQPYWVGHPEYTAPDGIQASEAGALVIANLIWATMQEYCIAQ